MGFLSAYEGVERIPVGDGYWVEVKKCLSSAEMQAAEKVLAARPTVDPGTGHGSTQIDPAGYRNTLMAASIVDWNLDEDDGTVWALTPVGVKHRNIARLPSSVYEQVWHEVDKLNEKTTPAGQKQFRDETVSGDPDGEPGATDPGDVPDGAAALAAPGATPGGHGEPALA